MTAMRLDFGLSNGRDVLLFSVAPASSPIPALSVRPGFAFGGLGIDLDELREIATVIQRGGDGGLVRLEAVGTDLEAGRPVGGPPMGPPHYPLRSLKAASISRLASTPGTLSGSRGGPP